MSKSGGKNEEKTAEIIFDGDGSHFDPDVVNAFRETENNFRQIATEFADNEDERENAFG